jgi:fructooligosaccharide transport system substrate-binding protein
MATRRQLLAGAGGAALAAGLPWRAAWAQQDGLNVLWMGWPDEQVDPLMASFREAHPEIPISVEKIPFAQIFQTIEVRMGARGPDPDILIVDSPLTASYAARGYLMDLTPHLDQSRFTNSAIASATWDGNIYSAPFGSSSALLYYNKALLAEAGIEPPSADPADRLTWEEIVELGQKVADPANNRWGLIIEQAERPYQLLPLPQSLGAKAISDDGLEAVGFVDAPEMVEGFQFYQDLFQTHKISPPGVFDNNLTFELFGTGRSAFFIGNTYDLDILPQKYPNLDWGVAPHPYFAAGRPVTPTGAWNIGINANTDQTERAVTFIDFMMSEAAQRQWLNLRPYPPVLHSVWEAEAERFASPGWQIVRHELDETAVPRPKTPGWREYEDILRVAIRDMQTGAEVKSTLSGAAQRIDRELAKYR